MKIALHDRLTVNKCERKIASNEFENENMFDCDEELSKKLCISRINQMQNNNSRYAQKQTDSLARKSKLTTTTNENKASLGGVVAQLEAEQKDKN